MEHKVISHYWYFDYKGKRYSSHRLDDLMEYRRKVVRASAVECRSLAPILREDNEST